MTRISAAVLACTMSLVCNQARAQAPTPNQGQDCDLNTMVLGNMLSEIKVDCPSYVLTSAGTSVLRGILGSVPATPVCIEQGRLRLQEMLFQNPKIKAAREQRNRMMFNAEVCSEIARRLNDHAEAAHLPAMVELEK
jgi:hypothetical protein